MGSSGIGSFNNWSCDVFHGRDGDWNALDCWDVVLEESWLLDNLPKDLCSRLLDLNLLNSFNWAGHNDTAGRDPLTSLKGRISKGLGNL
jgi:hypothetical protein